MVISMLKIRRPLGRLIFNMGIAIPGKTVFLIETAPGSLFNLEYGNANFAGEYCAIPNIKRCACLPCKRYKIKGDALVFIVISIYLTVNFQA